MTAAERVGILASVIAVLARIVSTVALVAAVLWIALPALVVASANAAQAEGGDCPCCEAQAAATGIVACPSCPAGTPDEGALPLRCTTVAAAWFALSPASVAGIDPAPAEPPPR